ncbi:hypothetical protein [Tabrizicola sp.]|uniref:hypothetical protein n=1 Tax=Tabrizicola sp. TaxID=2005166 RepID=UPI003D2869F6
MSKIKLISLARDMVGNTATIRAEILENAGAYFRVKDTIEIEIEGGGRMNDAQITAIIKETYNG